MTGPAGEMPFLDHLEELRFRIFRSLGAVVVGCALGLWAVQRFQLVNILKQPIAPYLTGGKLVVTSPTDPVMIVFKLGFLVGLVLASPVILWQLWAFLVPAVEQGSERRVRNFVLFASALLVGGVVFGYFVALPAAVHYLTNYDKQVFDIQIRAADYYSFVTMVLIAMAIVFELPVFVLALVRLGILSTAQLRRNRRIGYFVVACVGVALPGIDPVTTVIETIPLWLLFELSIWLSILADRRAAAAVQASGASGG